VVGVADHLVVPQSRVADSLGADAAADTGPGGQEDDELWERPAPQRRSPTMIVHEGLSNPPDIAAPRASRARYPCRSPWKLSSTRAGNLTRSAGSPRDRRLRPTPGPARPATRSGSRGTLADPMLQEDPPDLADDGGMGLAQVAGRDERLGGDAV